jgi:hypothetical protein
MLNFVQYIIVSGYCAAVQNKLDNYKQSKMMFDQLLK